MAYLDQTFRAGLLEQGLVSETALRRAELLSQQTGDRLVAVLVNLGLVGDIDVARLGSSLLGVPLVGEDAMPSAPVLPDALRPRYLRYAMAVPLTADGETVEIALADPLDEQIPRAVELATGLKASVSLAPAGILSACLDRIYATEFTPGRTTAPQSFGVDADETERLRDMASEAPVIRLVNGLITRAAETRATDIHVEPFEDGLRVRYRCDGVLEEVERHPAASAPAILSRIKIMGQLDIAERRLPQDGRIRFSARGQELDIRLSIVPSLYGETAALRILNQASVVLDFAHLGLPENVRDRLMSCAAAPEGIVLVTGPTGSGKTTTLYTTLSRLNDARRKIMTVEDPIEYRLAGINQMQVRPQIGLTFATALRHFLRQDPDVLLVGEIRDIETVQMAMQAAMTGHLVLSTLHTESAAGAIVRLRDMGVEDYLIAATVSGIVAQRLVRLLCVACKEPDPDVTGDLGVASDDASHPCRPVGCPACRRTGFSGRIAIAEALVVDAAVREAISAHAGRDTLQALAVERGMVPMREVGLRLVRAGRTTAAEVQRAVREDS